MVGLEQFLIVILIVLLAASVACGVAAVVLLKKGLNANQADHNSEDERGNGLIGAGEKADTQSAQTGMGLDEAESAQSNGAGEEYVAELSQVRERIEAEQERVLEATRALEQIVQEHEQAMRHHQEMVAALKDKQQLPTVRAPEYSIHDLASMLDALDWSAPKEEKHARLSGVPYGDIILSEDAPIWQTSNYIADANRAEASMFGLSDEEEMSALTMWLADGTRQLRDKEPA